ncbi:rhodanese-like domain-containing protein [Flavobacterium muglaense]|uniref:Rhodanese-like domain-containing protein n=1 Tax=Flavobacterium muglaense TaxID=2764716 RepID=A0A923SHA0_9FLAO|nr:rhodanese-like domain-containing protein [Flavobacterium muglaense]MBC5838956.1 rhodanese-like domain-containing protein [Flavobacterium muglaense]MBC5845459.1 rhodanese-like domain-containing protein [Flavobacterium muglaense]
MINILKKIFGLGPAVNYSELLKQGAIIIDVRNPGEFKQGHIKGAINAPLNELTKHISKIKKDTTVITCCVSGIRSASAKSVLKSNGFTNVYNGGGWSSLKNKIQ